MTNKTEKPLSENIAFYDAGDYTVSAAIWRTMIDGSLYDTFEIGIRHKETNKFKLFQDGFNRVSATEVAKAISHLLATGYFSPDWCMKHFKGED